MALGWFFFFYLTRKGWVQRPLWIWITLLKLTIRHFYRVLKHSFWFYSTDLILRKQHKKCIQAHTFTLSTWSRAWDILSNVGVTCDMQSVIFLHAQQNIWKTRLTFWLFRDTRSYLAIELKTATSQLALKKPGWKKEGSMHFLTFFSGVSALLSLFLKNTSPSCGLTELPPVLQALFSRVLPRMQHGWDAASLPAALPVLHWWVQHQCRVNSARWSVLKWGEMEFFFLRHCSMFRSLHSVITGMNLMVILDF